MEDKQCTAKWPITEEINEQNKKYLETNDKKNITIQNVTQF